MSVGRPSFLVEPRTVPVKLEGADVDAVKEMGLNISEICRAALRRELGGKAQRGKAQGKDRLEKFRGMPAHVVGALKSTAIRRPSMVPRVIESLNEIYGRGLTVDDARALVPAF